MADELKPTADICDVLRERAGVLSLPWRDYGLLRSFAGPAVTVRVRDDNALVRQQCESDGNGRVLVVDNEGRSGVALVGANLGHLARVNGWAGIVVYGMVRDTAELIHEEIGIKAIGTCPMPPVRTGAGDVDVPVKISGVTVNPGDMIHADWDGVIVVAAGIAT